MHLNHRQLNLVLASGFRSLLLHVFHYKFRAKPANTPNKPHRKMSLGPPYNGIDDHETFHKFFERWIVEQNKHLQELVSAAKEHEERRGQEHERERERTVRSLLQRVIHHYEHYYSTKSRWARNEIMTMFNPTWRSTLEDAFLWIGGWRPSMAFHLLYSKSGLQLESRLEEIIRGLCPGDLADLSSIQLGRVDELQKKTIKEEKYITEKLAKQQEKVADTTMVELSHTATELMREGEAVDEGRINDSLAMKEEGLVDVFQRADDLRLKTLKGVLNILTPIQGVHFLIAAAELHLRFHEWGKKRDAKLHHRDGDQVGHGHTPPGAN